MGKKSSDHVRSINIIKILTHNSLGTNRLEVKNVAKKAHCLTTPRLRKSQPQSAAQSGQKASSAIANLGCIKEVYEIYHY